MWVWHAYKGHHDHVGGGRNMSSRPVRRRERPWGPLEGDTPQPQAYMCNDRAEDVIQASFEGTSRRTTRSSSSTTPAKSPPETQIAGASSLRATTTSILPFSGEPISLDDVLSSLPGRRDQVLEILQLIGPLNAPMLPLFVYGGASTGKTRTILQVFRHLNRHFVYVSCRSCHSARLLFESVLNQLNSHSKSSDNGYSSANRCERPSEFVDLLRNVLRDRQTYASKERSKNLNAEEPRSRGSGKIVYIIFDNVELIQHWGKNSVLMSLLFKIHDILKMPDLGLIYISRATPDIYYSHTGSMEPITVYFPDYTEDEICQILMRKQPNPQLYSSFLKVVLKLFFRVTRRLDELSISLKPLFQKYCEPLSDMDTVPDETMKRRLYDNIHFHITRSLDEVFEVKFRSFADTIKEKHAHRKRTLNKFGGLEAWEGLDFHMSISAKYLLISAFLASRNPATLDGAMFDSKGGSGNQRRKRKSSEISIQEKDNKAHDMVMKGPGSFSLERLLVIFQCITSVGEGSVEEVLEDGKAQQNGDTLLMSDVLLQLSTLCNANFISKGGSCPLECSTRYRSTVDEETALKVARSINFPLSKYLYRR